MPNTTPPINLDDLLARKKIYLITRQISDTTHNLATSTTPLPKDHLVVDRERQIIKIGDGVHTWSETPHHRHDSQYSTIIHGHYFGYGEKWFRACPRLWNVNDLPHHPELIPCNGQIIGPEQYVFLQDLYDGTSVATLASGTSMDTEQYTIQVEDDTGTLYDDGYKVFDTETHYCNIPNRSHDSVVTYTWSFKGNVLRPKQYNIYNTNSAAAPMSWVLEGCTEDDPNVWIELDAHSRDTSWSTDEVLRVDISETVSNNYYLRYRLRVTSWDTELTSTNIGVYKFYITGRLFGQFTMPYLPSPHPEFVYVVPMKDLEIGMKHEEIGDVGYTAAYNLTTPMNRLPLDGSAVTIVGNEQLYGICGQKYSPLIHSDMVSFSSDDTSTHEVIIELSHPKILGKFHIDNTIPDIYPTKIRIELEINESWEHIDTVIYTSKPENMMYHLSPSDRVGTKYRLIIEEWSLLLPGNDFTIGFKWYGSDSDQFFLPHAESHPLTNGDMVPYIVTRVRTEDINSSIVLELQEALTKAQNHIVMLTNRLTAAEVAIQNMSLGAP